MKPNQRIALTMDVASFILESLAAKEAAAIRSIVLFGSTARREADEESDIDLFIETDKRTVLEKPVRKAIDGFLTSVKFTRYWNFPDR